MNNSLDDYSNFFDFKIVKYENTFSYSLLITHKVSKVEYLLDEPNNVDLNIFLENLIKDIREKNLDNLLSK